MAENNNYDLKEVRNVNRTKTKKATIYMHFTGKTNLAIVSKVHKNHDRVDEGGKDLVLTFLSYQETHRHSRGKFCFEYS